MTNPSLDEIYINYQKIIPPTYIVILYVIKYSLALQNSKRKLTITSSDDHKLSRAVNTYYFDHKMCYLVRKKSEEFEYNRILQAPKNKTCKNNRKVQISYFFSILLRKSGLRPSLFHSKDSYQPEQYYYTELQGYPDRISSGHC